jgi:hypothetical protein
MNALDFSGLANSFCVGGHRRPYELNIFHSVGRYSGSQESEILLRAIWPSAKLLDPKFWVNRRDLCGGAKSHFACKILPDHRDERQDQNIPEIWMRDRWRLMRLMLRCATSQFILISLTQIQSSNYLLIGVKY